MPGGTSLDIDGAIGRGHAVQGANQAQLEVDIASVTRRRGVLHDLLQVDLHRLETDRIGHRDRHSLSVGYREMTIVRGDRGGIPGEGILRGRFAGLCHHAVAAIGDQPSSHICRLASLGSQITADRRPRFRRADIVEGEVAILKGDSSCATCDRLAN